MPNVAAHPMFRPLVEVRARIYDMQHDPATSEAMTWYDEEADETCAIGLKLPLTRSDWERKRRAVDAVMWDIGGVVTRVGDETIGEMWSLWDGKDILNEIDSRFGDNIERHIHEAVRLDPFHVSANTDPKGDRSKRPQEQDPDMLVHVVRGDGRRDRHPGGEVRDRRRVRRAGVPEADHRELGGRQAVGLRGSAALCA